MPTPVTIYRADNINQIAKALKGWHCVSLVGLSNMGKSTLLRMVANAEQVHLTYEEKTSRPVNMVYVDCNGMLELSGQGFYELILRALQNRVTEPDLQATLAEHYQRVVEPDSQFMVPLSFNHAMTDVIEVGQHDIVLLFDEFDDVFDALDGRVFLNLRHLKDKYPRNFTYVTATTRRLGATRADEQTAEFVELTAPYTYMVTALKRHEADDLAQGLADYSDVQEPLNQKELDFLWAQAGGHPRLLRAAVGQFAELYHKTTNEEVQTLDDLDSVVEHFRHDPTIRTELSRMLGQIGPEERQGITAIAMNTSDALNPRIINQLMRWGLVRSNDNGPQIFAKLLEDYIQRQARVQQELPTGVWVDVDSGEAWVDGISAPDLTELEFKLIELLFERSNKVTDKYQIVETVWGVDYIDEVDDSRIEKLVSRLRAKIEPDTGSPRYIVTVRGRGYKLVTPD